MLKRFALILRFSALRWVTGFFVMAIFSGCQTVPSVQSERETRKETQEALSAVAGAISGRTLTDEELRNLEKQIREDKEAQTAIQAITGSVGGQTPVVKYCPVTGKRYASYMEICPEHHVPLKTVEP